VAGAFVALYLGLTAAEILVLTTFGLTGVDDRMTLVEKDEDDDRAQGALADPGGIERQRLDDGGVHGLIEFASEHLGDDHVADDLDRAAGRACRGPDQQDPEQDDGAERDPVVEVGAGEAGGRQLPGRRQRSGNPKTLHSVRDQIGASGDQCRNGPSGCCR